MSPVRVCIDEEDVPRLELALGYALSTWTHGLVAGRPAAWEAYAMTGHAIRNTLSWMEAVAGQRVVFWSDDSGEALHAVAREVEGGPPDFAALSKVVRRYADCAADPTGCCVRIPGSAGLQSDA